MWGEYQTPLLPLTRGGTEWQVLHLACSPALSMSVAISGLWFYREKGGKRAQKTRKKGVTWGPGHVFFGERGVTGVPRGCMWVTGPESKREQELQRTQSGRDSGWRG